MSRTRVGVVAVAVVAAGVMVLGGCPESNLLTDVLNDPQTAALLDEAGVFELLASLAKADPPTADGVTAAEEPYFGEPVALYEAVPAVAVELSEADILSEASAPDVEPPGPHGKVAGRFWSDCLDPNITSDTCGGIFRGRWFDPNDNVRGVVRGRYHPVRPEDLPEGIVGGGIFRGTILDLKGRPIGWLHGRYGHAENAGGQFWGRWVGRHHELIGVVKGHWQDDPNLPGGTFAGRWVAINVCDEVASLPDYEFQEGDFDGLEPTDEDLPVMEMLGTMAGEPLLNTERPVHEEPDVRYHPVPPCIDPNQPWGFLRGWHAPNRPDPNSVDAEEPVGGWFRGRWRNHQGDKVGILMGRYRPLPTPEPEASVTDEAPTDTPELPGIMGVYYGKVVTLQGKFRGYVRGVYGRGQHGMGVFRGRYFDADGQALGVMFGRWSNHPVIPGGPFFGFWNGKEHLAEPDLEPTDAE